MTCAAPPETPARSARATIARLIEKDLASGAVTRFNAPPKIHYAKGTSQLIFGEFRTVSEAQSGKPALIWTAADYDNDDRHSVAICMFGSMSNFTEYIQNAPPASTNPWSASFTPTSNRHLTGRVQEPGLPGRPDRPPPEASWPEILQAGRCQVTMSRCPL